jgi:hypothetical protein
MSSLTESRIPVGSIASGTVPTLSAGLRWALVGGCSRRPSLGLTDLDPRPVLYCTWTMARPFA